MTDRESTPVNPTASRRRLQQRGLAKLIGSAIDTPSVGLGFGLVGVVIAVLVFGTAPVVVGVGLLALLVVD
ncbi:hypothetical protein [Enhygromyxa salina]|uniref:Uncharacterized protein n=1 Tax=Enhygromyxa salina TaxID=215803 RepID=A0A2S9YPL9_9BACT|nr:hypothetical protein [Enhygromyxa salina]PRQ07022.1 hypothetical protein ENSA7_32460 [Enhygromyxa salina]